MTDIYDYAYGHVFQRPEEPTIISPRPESEYIYETSSDESNSEAEVNTADFSPRDLQMFVDSLEAIARLEQAKVNGKPKRKVKKPTQSPKRRQVTCLDSSTCESIDEDDVNSFSNLSWSSSSEYFYEEAYFGLPNQGQSTALYHNLMSMTVPDASDSEESGVFVNNTSEGHLYENIDALKPKSKMISYSKSKSLKSRIISLFLKKQSAKSQKPTTEILSSTTIDEQNEADQMYERILAEVVKEERETKKSKTNKKKPSGNNSEDNILTKAIRMLTL